MSRAVTAMVTRSCDVQSRAFRFVVRPNQSLTWGQIKLVFLGIAAVSLTIGGAFALMGLWPVLPFAGLELAALGSGLYYCARCGQRREVITVGDDTVRIEKGRRGPEADWSFPRTRTRIGLDRSGVRTHPSRLYVRSQGRDVEIGQFLTEGERQELARDLGTLLA